MSDLTEESREPLSSDLSGRRLGNFQLLRLLGRGAMAQVYLAEQSDLKRQVAVKVLKSDLALDETYVKRFQREAQAAASLSHASIVQIYEVGCSDRVHYIAQEYVQGQNLLQWMGRNGTADLALAVSVLRQVTAALAKAAELGIVHRDIKPENIILARAGEVKVADFGLARLPPRLGELVDLTQAGITLGTPLYMSPEQVEGKPLDHRSDLYSLGVTCYHLLAARPPFTGETALSVAVQHLKKQPEPLENLRPDLPPALCRIIHKMLAKDPAKRYQSARELLRELYQVQLEHLGNQWPEECPVWDSAGVPLGGEPATSEATQRLDSLMKTSSMIRLGRPRWSVWLSAGLVAFVLGGLAAYYLVPEESLLADSRMVKRRDDVLQQYIYASRVRTEEAWQAVIAYYPTQTYFVYRAKQQLARIYLNEGRFNQALPIFQELAGLEDTETDLRVFGLAGQCAVFAIQKNDHEFALALDELWPLRVHLRDPFLRQIVYQTLRANRAKLGGAKTSQEWQGWMKQHFPESG